MKHINRKTILYVEDEVIIATIIKRDLEKHGYDVITEMSGEAAIETIEKNPDIDLILMDVYLGDGMDGVETAAIINKKFDLPVVFFSVHVDPEIVGKVKKINSYGYLVKNSSTAILDVAIKQAFMHFQSKKEMQEEIAKCRKAEEEVKKLLSEKEILLQEVHHRIRNNMKSVEDLLLQQPQLISNPDDFYVLKDAIGSFGEIVPSVYQTHYH